ncbi:hypothetical protein [Streptomyces beijiangensis]|uniref:Uncharacterized protein n=1 Tax=Streptomyces beijiangensis TaxID=163361 RepID=A0A939JGY4_9ACTN|nr:hypothetical protein [Streptomyces beijiangensis]MBO0513888.1 hypothetical protein [Streptomyces beijiangensis]
MTGTQSTRQAAYATDGTDYRGAARHQFVYALKGFLKYLVGGVLLIAVVVLGHKGYLIPVGIVGLLMIAYAGQFWIPELNWAFRVRRVLRTYPLVFRTPAEQVFAGATGTARQLRMGGKGAGGSPLMRGKFMRPNSGSWPEGAKSGVWFAGDDAFGGLAIVPGSGELFFMQPDGFRHNASACAAREAAGEDRRQKASSAGLQQFVNFQVRW